MFIKEIKGFLTKEQCNQIILEHQELEPSTTGINRKFKGSNTGRTSFTARTIESPTLDIFKSKVASLTSLPQENQEAPSIINYPVAGYYHPHYDYFDESDEDFEKLVIPRGGQRVQTCLLYLNDNFTGGFTTFPKLKVKIVPEAGKLVWWDNARDESLHAGTSVTFGTKWIATIWIRENKWTPLP
jgi:prolyl 4-hydroxylase